MQTHRGPASSSGGSSESSMMREFKNEVSRRGSPLLAAAKAIKSSARPVAGARSAIKCRCCDAVYEGEVNGAGLPHGFGTLTTAEYHYTGQFRNGRRTGEGQLVFDKIVWKGQLICVEDCSSRRSALGFSSYEGDIKANLPHGRGIMRWGNGCEYEGEFVNGRREGRGVFRHKDYSLECVWTNDAPASSRNFGTLKSKGTYKYVGQLLKGRPNGFGRLYYTQKATVLVHEGLWSAGVAEGYGVFFHRGTSTDQVAGHFHNSLIELGGNALPASRVAHISINTYPLPDLSDDLMLAKCVNGAHDVIPQIQAFAQLVTHEQHFHLAPALPPASAAAAVVASEPTTKDAEMMNLFADCNTEFKLKCLEGLSTRDPDVKYFQVSISVGATTIWSSSRSRNRNSSVLTWDEIMVLPVAHEQDERVYIQVYGSKEHRNGDAEERPRRMPPSRIIGGGFVKLSSGHFSCMLIGRDPDTGFRGPVGLVRMYGSKVISLEPHEIQDLCLTL